MDKVEGTITAMCAKVKMAGIVVVAAVAVPVALVAPKDESEREMVRLVAMKF